MRKKNETLQESLLGIAREMANTNGPDSINIREIAKKAGIATGTVYNYFQSKDDILLALTEEYWKNTLLEMRKAITAESFYVQLNEIYEFLSHKIDHSAGLLMSSLGRVELVARERMKSMQQVLGRALIVRMEQDPGIRKDIWNDTFTKEKYAGFIIMNMMLLLQTRSSSISFFIEIVKKTLY